MYYQDCLVCVQDFPSPDGIWELVEKIGEGNYGVVFKGRNRKSGKIGAVKIMDAIMDKEEDIKAELNIFQKFSAHENIVDCYGVYLKKQDNGIEQLWIVMEHCAGGSVTDLVKKVKEKGESLSEDIIAYILREVLAGLIYLHHHHIIHRDVKGQNVLLTYDARVRLIDFGISAKVSESNDRRRTAIGTPYWMPPEVIACENQLDCDYDARSDVWSLGITAIEIVDGTPPWFGENPIRALYKIPKNPPPKLQNPTRWSMHLNQFIAKCLVKDFECRPTSSELLHTDLIVLVPKDSRMVRRKLMAVFDTYLTQGNVSEGLVSDQSSPSSAVSTGLDTAQRKMLGVDTLELADDLATLEYIDEEILVGQLMKRYRKGLIYTYVGDVLVSVNPFQNLPDVYHPKVSKQYRQVTKTTKGHLSPHIYAIAGAAYQEMIRENKNQCCVVSGESGAGKTEASNILVQQFMQLGRAKTRVLGDKIVSLNPLLESFGNARTIINSNSSRFGKYLELKFTVDGLVVGAHLSEYLLEKSRVISQGGRERNFHIFYYLLAGLQERKLSSQYKVKRGHQFRYLRQIGTSRATAKQNKGFAEKFDQVENAFYLFDFSKEEFHYICCILAGILNIGDIIIEEDTNTFFHLEEVSAISNLSRLDDICELLSIDSCIFERILVSSNVMTHGETIVRPNTVEQAMDCRDAIAKSLYGRLFSWIVNKINPSLNPSKENKLLTIGILDIFGFENFRSNSFEQLCINITNEQLQFYFNQHVFAWEQEEYEREGVDVTNITYTDNRSLLDLLINRPMGLLALLDEECKFPRATDLSLAAKFHRNFHQSPHYVKPKDNGPTFMIHHYAGTVLYNTQGFLEKNRDTLKPDVVTLLRDSSNIIVHQLFTKNLTRTGSLPDASLTKIPGSATPLFNKRRPKSKVSHLSDSVSMTTKRSQTVSTYFFYSLRELMYKMLMGTPHFVRCIRPNDLKTPKEFHPERVIEQLRYTGVLETTRIRREGYSHRILFDDFIQRYRIISYSLSQYVPPTPVNCIQVLMQAGLKNWTIGKTKVFLKYYHIERLWNLLTNYHRLATKLQCVARVWLAKREVKRRKRDKAAVCIQSAIRRYLIRKHYKATMKQRNEAAVLIQKSIRGYLCKNRYKRLQLKTKASIVIQSYIRMWICRKLYLNQLAKASKAAQMIQRSIRQWLMKKKEKREQEMAKEKQLTIQKQSVVILQRAFRKYNKKKEAIINKNKSLLLKEGNTNSLRSKLELHVTQEIMKQQQQNLKTENNENQDVHVTQESVEQLQNLQTDKEENESKDGNENDESVRDKSQDKVEDRNENKDEIENKNEVKSEVREQEVQTSDDDFKQKKHVHSKLTVENDDRQSSGKEYQSIKDQANKGNISPIMTQQPPVHKEEVIKLSTGSGQTQQTKMFFEELGKRNQKFKSKPQERLTKKTLQSDFFLKLLQHFDHSQ